MRIYKTDNTLQIESDGAYYDLDADFDDLVNTTDLARSLELRIAGWSPMAHPPEVDRFLPPIGRQEVWAAGVTYFRSRDARMEESKKAGGDDFYARVYEAVRPELFFKSSPHRVVGHGDPVRIRSDSNWNVPEPELTLLVNARAEIVGYTIGNDMSSRDIEGENPLYLPQAKVYDASCALGPCVLVHEGPVGKDTRILIEIQRDGNVEFHGQTDLHQLKRGLEELVGFLFRDNSFPHGCYLMTGTGIVPPSTFTLHPGDVIRITIDGIGELVNAVADNAGETRKT